MKKNTAGKTFRTGVAGEQGNISRIFPGLIEHLAKWLENKTACYSKAKLILLFFLFCAAVIFLLCRIAMKGFDDQQRPAVRFERLPLEKIKPPVKNTTIPSQKEIKKKLEEGRRYLDSLAKTPALKQKYDSLMSARPGLLDSLRRVEEYYNNGLK